MIREGLTLFSLPAHSMIPLCLFWLCVFVNTAGAAETAHPLAPPDTSSPRATLQTFLDNVNEAARAYKSGDRPEAIRLAQRSARCLDLEKEPPALRRMIGFYATLYLEETLNRIEIPPSEQIPGAEEVRKNKISSWTLPYTEITIERVKDPTSIDRFLFSNHTVRNSEAYYKVVKKLPYRTNAGHGALLALLKTSGSLILSKRFEESLPSWAKVQFYGQAAWQWIGLTLYFCIAAAVLALLHTWGGKALGKLEDRSGSHLWRGVRGLIFPAALILVSKFGLWFLVYGLRFLNAYAYVPIALIFLVASYGGWIWLIGALLNRLAAILVYVSGFVRGGLDDQIIRMGLHMVTVLIVAVMTVALSARLGLPTYSLLTGVGIGGLAVALAGREALSNIIGTIMIVLDRPFKLGDYILLEKGERGEVTEVGLRSTRIKTRDDILISIPNSIIANGKLINESAPVSMSRIRIKVGVSYSADLATVERAFLDVAERNEAVLANPSPRVRFRGFGESTLDFELLCWIGQPVERGRVTHQLNWAIKEEFQQQGLEIPFPQRDIHMRSET